MKPTTHTEPHAVLDMLLGTSHNRSSPILDEASVLHMSGSSGLSGDYQGRESISELLRRMVELTDGTLHLSTPQVLIANDQTIVLRSHLVATRGGAQLDSEVVLILALSGDRLREMWVHHSDQSHVDDFWATHRPRR